MIRTLKSAVAAASVTATHEQVSEVVRGIIADVRDRGDAAVREYSERFDHWAPESFQLDMLNMRGLHAADIDLSAGMVAR